MAIRGKQIDEGPMAKEEGYSPEAERAAIMAYAESVKDVPATRNPKAMAQEIRDAE